MKKLLTLSASLLALQLGTAHAADEKKCVSQMTSVRFAYDYSGEGDAEMISNLDIAQEAFDRQHGLFRARAQELGINRLLVLYDNRTANVEAGNIKPAKQKHHIHHEASYIIETTDKLDELLAVLAKDGVTVTVEDPNYAEECETTAD